MRNAWRYGWMALVPALLTGVALAQDEGTEAPSLDEVRTAVGEAWAPVSTMTADVDVSAIMIINEARLALRGDGNVVYSAEGDTPKFRQVLQVTLPEPLTMSARVDALYDGELLNLQLEFLNRIENQQAEPALRRGAVPPGGAQLMAVLADDTELTSAPKTMLDGASCFVLEATPKTAGEGLPFATATVFITEERGMLRRVILFDEAGAEMAQLNFTNALFDEAIAPERFVQAEPESAAEPESSAETAEADENAEADAPAEGASAE